MHLVKTFAKAMLAFMPMVTASLCASCDSHNSSAQLKATETASKVTYAKDLQPMVQGVCEDCHGLSAEYFKQAVADGRLMNRNVHPGGSLNDPQRAKIEQWIKDGQLD